MLAIEILNSNSAHSKKGLEKQNIKSNINDTTPRLVDQILHHLRCKKPKNDGMTYVPTGTSFFKKISPTCSTIDVLDAKNHGNEALGPSTIDM